MVVPREALYHLLLTIKHGRAFTENTWKLCSIVMLAYKLSMFFLTGPTYSPISRSTFSLPISQLATWGSNPRHFHGFADEDGMSWVKSILDMMLFLAGNILSITLLFQPRFVQTNRCTTTSIARLQLIRNSRHPNLVTRGAHWLRQRQLLS